MKRAIAAGADVYVVDIALVGETEQPSDFQKQLAAVPPELQELLKRATPLAALCSPRAAPAGDAEPWGAASSGGPAGASPQLSPQQLREWLLRRARLWSGATGAGGAGDAGTRGAGVTSRAGGTGRTATASPGGARTRGTGAVGAGGVGDARAGDPTEPRAAGAGGSCAGGVGARGAGATGAGVVDPGAGVVDPGAGGAGGTVRPRPYFVPLHQQVLGVPSSTSLTLPLLCPPPDQSQPPLLPASPLPAPSPYTEQSGGLTEHRECERTSLL
ncbi:unnamed protein product [Closterium sp. NIES-54]